MDTEQIIDTNKLNDKFSQVFFRFFIPGMVFILFAILLPSFFIVETYSADKCQNGTFVMFLNKILKFVVNQPTLFILIAIAVGILLDLSKFYSFLTGIIFPKNENSPWYSLKILIVKAFNIGFNEKLKKEYLSSIKKLAFRIHSLFIRSKHPVIDQKIENSRVYPDILSMSLLSIVIGSFFLLIALIIKISLCEKQWPIYLLPLFIVAVSFIVLAVKTYEESIEPSVFDGQVDATSSSSKSNNKIGTFDLTVKFVCLIVFPIVLVLYYAKFGQPQYLYLFIPFWIGVIIFLAGIEKVIKEFLKLNQLTKSLVEDAFESVKIEDKIEFFIELKKIGLIEEIKDEEKKDMNEENEWKKDKKWKIKKKDIKGDTSDKKLQKT